MRPYNMLNRDCQDKMPKSALTEAGRGCQSRSARRSVSDAADLRFKQFPGGGVETLAPAGVEVAERGPDAPRIGGVDDHPRLFQRLGAAGIDRLDLFTLHQRVSLGIALDNGLDLARQGGPGIGVCKQREPG